MTQLYINKFLPFTNVEGPGLRSCIWVQGCPIQCKGCYSPNTWTKKHGQKRTIYELFEKIKTLKRIDGVTFSGGEPFFQANALAKLAKLLKDKLNLNIVVFTGYTIEDIIDANMFEWELLLSLTDLLIDGPFITELKTTKLPWVGSSNQRYHFLTDEYLHLKSKLKKQKRKFELLIHPNGEVSINGLIDQKELDYIKKGFLIK